MDHRVWLLRLSDVASDVEFELRRAREIHIDVRAVVVAVVGVVVVIRKLVQLLEDSVLVEIANRHEIVHILVASGYVHIVLGLEENVVAHHFRPVDIGIHYRVGTCPVCLYCFT